MLKSRTALEAGGVVSAASDAERPILPLRVEGLSYEVAGTPLIDDIDLTLAPQNLTIVMGPNGAGKSLLLRLLHGLIPPTAGKISFAGAPLSQSLRRRQAMVFQRPVLLRRSVAANIDFVLKPKHKGAALASRRDALLAQVGLGSQARQPARLLSGGEQQRLALARALAIDPDILFLDEPTASLDPASVMIFEEILCGVAAAGTKIVFVTHDIGQAKRLADDIVFLNRGKLAEHSAAKSFFANPQSVSAKAYLEGRLVL